MSLYEEFKKIIHSRIDVIVTLVFSLLFNLSCFLPRMDEIGAVNSGILSAIFVVPTAMALWVVIVLVNRLIDYLNDVERTRSTEPKKVCGVLLFVGLFIAWGVEFLTSYPARCSTDTYDIIKMIMGMDFQANHFRYSGLNSHHPLAHVLMVGVFIKGSLLLGGTIETGLALVAIMQMAVLAASATYACITIYRTTSSLNIMLITYFFWLFNPLIAGLSVTIWKDIMFSAIALYFLNVATNYLKAKDGGKTSSHIAMIVSAILLSALRSGGIVFPLAFFLSTFILMKKQRKEMCKNIVIVVLTSVFLVNGLGFVLHAEKGHFSESIATPLQQVSRVVVDKGDINQREMAFLDRLLPIEEYEENYWQDTVNGIKFSENFDDNYLEENKREFFFVWLGMGMRNAKTYIQAWIEETKGFWNTATDTVYYLPYSGYQSNQEFGTSHSMIPWITPKLMDTIVDVYIKNTKVITKGSSLAWIYFLMIVIGIVRRKKKNIVLLAPNVVLLMLYIFNSPISEQFRYVFPLYLSLPLMVAVFLGKSCGLDSDCAGMAETPNPTE